MQIKSRVGEWMETRGVTIYALAKEAGVAKETVTRARGEEVEACTIKTLKKLATALGVQIRDLFDE